MLDIDELSRLERLAAPGSGGCAAMFTASSMAFALEAMGMALPGSASHPAMTREDTRGIPADKVRDCEEAADAVVHLLATRLSARQIITKKALENAVTVLYACGGSTNAVLHLLAIAHEADIPKEDFCIDDFDRVGRHVPLLAACSPHGKFHVVDIDEQGGLPVIMKELLEAGFLHGDCLTCTGATVAENLTGVPSVSELPAEQEVLYPVSQPYKPAGNHILVLRGNLCPDSAVCKVSSPDRHRPTPTSTDLTPISDDLQWSRPKLHRASSRARRTSTTAGRPSASTRRTRRTRPSSTGASKRETSSSCGTRGQRARPACPRCSCRAARSSAAASARTWRS